jgi:hypothetical protein
MRQSRGEWGGAWKTEPEGGRRSGVCFGWETSNSDLQTSDDSVVRGPGRESVWRGRGLKTAA